MECKGTIIPCSACGSLKTMLVENRNDGAKNPIVVSKFFADAYSLKQIGVTKLPTSGWHLQTNKDGKKVRMYPVCQDCYKKINLPKKRAKIINNAKNK